MMQSTKSLGPWHRKRKVEIFGNQICLHSSEEKFDTFTLANMALDINAKRAALKIAPSVVSLVSHLDGRQVFEGSGTIIDCVEQNGTYWSSILTSATLLPRSTGSLTLPSDIKIDVRLSTGRLVDGHVFAYDWHFNIASIKIQTSAPLPVATLRLIDDSVSIVAPSTVQSFQLRPHSDAFKVSPGDFVLAIGRYHKKPYDLMAAPGRFSLGSCNFECKQLFFADCKISKAGIGGPLVNQNGDVIGMSFYHEDCTPFLPINIASKGLYHFDKYQKFARPWIGVEVANLYTADVAKLEKFNQQFPHTSVGVLVEQVVEGSPAAEAGLLSGDVITQCAGTLIRGFTEFFDVVLDNVGKVVKLVVLRYSTGACYSRDIHVQEANQDNFYSWPVPKESWEYASLR